MKYCGKIKGYTYKITHISLDNCPRVSNLILTEGKTVYSFLMDRYENNFIYISINFNDNIRNEKKSPKKQGVFLQNDSYLTC